jgi:hypothetical protein
MKSKKFIQFLWENFVKTIMMKIISGGYKYFWIYFSGEVLYYLC